MRLADDPLFQPLLQFEHAADLVRHHAAHRDAGPPGHHLGNRLSIDAGAHQRRLSLHLLELLLEAHELGPQCLLLRLRQRGDPFGRLHGRHESGPLGPDLLDEF